MLGTSGSGELLIRRRKVSDLPQAAAALVAVYERDGYPVEGVAEPIAWLCPHNLLCAWVAELKGKVVGHVAVSGDPDGHNAVLERLFVAPEARGLRGGERLIRSAEAYARSESLTLTLEVLLKDEAAIHLYQRLGWSEMGRSVHRLNTGQTHAALTFVAPQANE